MDILLHTIALEPARWTPQRVSQSLVQLLGRLGESGLRKLEIFEPHLDFAENEAALSEAIRMHGLEPVVLSSYLQLNPVKTQDAEFASALARLAKRVTAFRFRKVRLFPGQGVTPDEEAAIARVRARILQVADAIPETLILLETHDGSIADDPQRVVKLVGDVGRENVGLLYQPTIFAADFAIDQFEQQQPFIRHLHLQNRKPDRSFETLEAGVVPWAEILRKLDFAIDATIEFVPSGICPVDQFDLERSLREIASEAAYIRRLAQ